MQDTTADAAGVGRSVPSTRDPRPVIVDGPDGKLLAGGRCTSCGHPSAVLAPRCARCAAVMTAAQFGPDGDVWSTTTIHVPSADLEAPYTLAYVDLDDGPRVLAHVENGPAISLLVAERVRLIEPSGRGDPQVRVLR